MAFRVTYATLTADDSELQAAYTAALNSVRSELGSWHPLWIGDDEWFGDQVTGRFTTVSPIDTSLQIGHFSIARASDNDDG